MLGSSWVVAALKELGIETNCNNKFTLYSKLERLYFVSRHQMQKYNRERYIDSAEEYLERHYDIVYRHFFGYILKEIEKEV